MLIPRVRPHGVLACAVVLAAACSDPAPYLLPPSDASVDAPLDTGGDIETDSADSSDVEPADVTRPDDTTPELDVVEPPDVAPDSGVPPRVVGIGEVCDGAGVCGAVTTCGEGLACVSAPLGVPICVATCDLRDSGACAEFEGAACIDIGAPTGVCALDDLACTSDASCDSGGALPRMTCLDLGFVDPFCAPRHLVESTEGAACGEWSGDTCVPTVCQGPGLECVEGRCVEPRFVGEGGICDAAPGALTGDLRRCAEGLDCVYFDERYGTCVQPCGDETPCGRTDLSCVGLGGGAAACLPLCDEGDCALNGWACAEGIDTCLPLEPVVAEPPGGFCSQTATFFFDAHHLCRDTQFCYPIGFTQIGVCLDRCITVDDCPGVADRCVDIADADGGWCAETCTSDDDCGDGRRCNADLEVAFCVPVPDGAAGLLEDCIAGAANPNGSESLTCAPDAPFCAGLGGEFGRCTVTCETIDDCPIVDGVVPACLATESGESACAWGCADDGRCPSGLECVGEICR